MARSLARDLALALAVALALTLAAGAVMALRTATEQSWLPAGFYRLAVRTAWDRFDTWLPLAAGAALAVTALAQAIRRWQFRPSRIRPGGPLALLALVAGLRAGTAIEARYTASGPNLLLISIDTLRADHLGTYGYALPTSPTIDARLAGEGVTFTDVYSQSPKTTPSHMTMLTSLYPSVHGVELWENGRPAHVLNPTVHTLAEVLKNAGYATAAFTGGAQVDPARGFDQGFDLYTVGGQRRRALRWLGRYRWERFFVFYHTYDVHDPYLPPDEYIRMFDPDYSGRVLDAVHRLRAEGSMSEAEWEGLSRRFWASVDRSDPRAVHFVERLYDAGIRRMDQETVRPLLDKLDQLGLARNTLVVFTSDHGEAFGEHGHFMHDDLYVGTLHVPLILRLPGALPAGLRVGSDGSRLGSRARLIDVMPTVLGLLGVPAPPTLQGQSLTPFLRSEFAGTLDLGGAVSEYSNGRVFESLREGQMAYIVDGSEERLFDLRRDPGEREDVLGAHPADAAAMRQTLERWRRNCRALALVLGPRGDTIAPSDETARRLRALGYLE